MPLQPETLAPPPVTPAPRQPAWLAMLVVALAIAALLAHGPLGLPDRIPRLVIDNPTDYDVLVTARRPGEPDRLVLASVGRGSHLEVTDPIDLGDTWVFHFAGQGVDGMDVSVPRRDLADRSWTLVVPPEVADDLAAKGAPPTPLRSGGVTG